MGQVYGAVSGRTAQVGACSSDRARYRAGWKTV
jgi:hypothetical protein